MPRKRLISGTRQFYVAACHGPGGTPVFAGTRVPVQTLLDYLEGGESIDHFLDGLPSVKREPIVAFLEQARDSLIGPSPAPVR